VVGLAYLSDFRLWVSHNNCKWDWVEINVTRFPSQISTGLMDSSSAEPSPMMRHYSSSGNISSISSDREEIRPVPRARPDPQIPDTTLPLIKLPPEKTEITSYSVLLRHLQQSELIFDAFQKTFGMTYCSAYNLIRLEDGQALLKFLENLNTPEARDDFIFTTEAHPVYGRAVRITLRGFDDGGFGNCLLISMYTHSIESVIAGKNETETKALVKESIDAWIAAFKQLHPLPDPEASRRIEIYESYKEAVINAFDLEYYDPHKLVAFYGKQLVNNMALWVSQSTEYNAPYGSIINSSMMGKSRLLKEIAMNIPTVYICVREVNDGYPGWSPKVVRDYLLTGTHFDHNLPATVNEDTAVRAIMALFVGLLTHLHKFCKHYGTEKEQLRQLRKDLFITLAEPSRTRIQIKGFPNRDMDVSNAESFWKAVITLADESKDFRKEILFRKLVSAWTQVEGFFSTAYGTEPMLLMVWDEARTLVKIGLDGNPVRLSQFEITMFRIMRRAWREIGRHGSKPILRIFSLVTDTSSRVGNFQPRHDSDSSREVPDPVSGSLMFRPIVVMPTFDYSARIHLKLTCNHHTVKSPERLLAYGRTAWHAMWQTKAIEKAVSFIPLAISKLFRSETLTTLKVVFESEINEHVKLKMLACLGPRLAIQTGSYVTATRELIASHMMTLLRVGRDHDQLEAFFASEPILAEASAQATAEYGWAKPLEVLVSELRHGVVYKGFRGEFITKVLACMAIEDALRPSAHMPAILKKSWSYTRPVSVSRFLNNLLRNPQGINVSTPTTEQFTAPTVLNATGKRVFTAASESDSKRSKQGFDDQSSGDEEEASVRNTDQIPGLDKPRSIDYIVQEARRAGIAIAREDNNEELKTLLGGKVFFNHFVVLHTKLRPSILLKAWNRCAAIMTKSQTWGVDVIIPIVVKDVTEEVLKSFGPLFGEWTAEQEKAADAVIAYILVQTKNRAKAKAAKWALSECIPDNNNFDYHSPSNPFVSILMELGVEESNGVQVVNPCTGKEIHRKQLPIVAYGLTARTYKCLDGRGNVERMLKLLQEMDRNPLRGLKDQPEVAAALRDCLPLACHPGREDWIY
jgi:hypothetical protein